MIRDVPAPTVGDTPAGDSASFLPLRTSAPDATDAPVAAPWQIEGYEIVAQLGQGGMGVVWRAVQLSTRREVALKLLHTGLAPSERARRRFEREIELTASLQHPGIAAVYDSGVQKGAYFYAMELIDGVPVDQYVAERHPSRREIIKLFHSIVEAVQYAHQRGVIHRDLKPSNVLVDRQGKPHVLDFGVAKLFDLKSSDPPVSIDGEVVGTPAFMSPEQAEGSARGVDVRSDVYSLGAVLYLLLTGQLPHDTAGTYVKVLRRISEQEIIRPTKARADIGSELEAILLKALARDVELRYHSAGAFADDLNNYLLGEPLLARRRTALYFARKKLWKHRYVAAAVLAGLTVLGGFAVRDAMRTRSERDFAIASAAKERAANRLAQLHLADAMLAWGDSLAAASQWEQAREKYWQAHDIWVTFGLPTTAADAALVDSYRHAPLPLIEFQIPPAPHLAAAFTANGIAAYSGNDGTITTVDPCTGLQQSFPGRVKGNIGECHFTEDGGRITSLVNPRNQLGRLEPTCMAEIQQAQGAGASIFVLSGTRAHSLTLSPDGRFLAYVACPEGTDVGANAFCETLDPLSAPMKLPLNFPYAFAFSPDSRNLYVGDNQSWINKFQTADGSTVWKTRCNLGGISAIQCVARTNGLLVGSRSGRLALCDRAGKVVRAWVGHPTSITNLAVSHDATHALSSDADGLLRLWDIDSGSLEFSVQAHFGPLASLAISGDGSRALSADKSGSIKLWPIRRYTEVVGSLVAVYPTALALSPDGQLAACGHGNGLVVLYDAFTGKCLYRLSLGHLAIDSICFSSDGLEIYAGQAGAISRWAVGDPAHRTSFQIALDDTNVPQVPDESRTLFSGQGNVAINIKQRVNATFWDTGTGQRRGALTFHTGAVAALSADGRAVLVGTASGIHVGDVASGRTIAECVLPGDDPALQVALSPYARTGLVSTRSGKLYLWHIGKEGDVHLLASEVGVIKHIRFSPDGNFAVTGSDSALKLWDIPNQRELRTLSAAENMETLVAFGGDSNILFVRPGEGDVPRLRLIDLHMPAAYRELATRVPAAWRDLQANPDDGNALSTIGQWYALRGETDWAGKLLEAARGRGAQVPLMVLARIAWKSGKSDQAAGLLRQMLQSETSPAQRAYLTVCLRAAEEEAKLRSPLANGLSPAPQEPKG